MKKYAFTFLSLVISNLFFGQNLQWAKSMGGTSSEYGNSIAVDVSGNVYTTGYFQGSADFDPNTGTFNLTEAGSNDLFVSKLDASGNFAWAKKIGDALLEEGISITVDASSNVYVTGKFAGTVDFNPGSGTNNLTSTGSYDAFILKLDAAGNFVWTKNLGGTGDDNGIAIKVDASGNVYTTGRFQGTSDFDPNGGINNLISSGNWDIFISKLNSSGNFVWAKSMGGTTVDGAGSLQLDASGNIYTSGFFSGTVDFDPGAGVSNLTAPGTEAIFISKLNAAGNFVWAKSMGGNYSAFALSILADALGNVYTTGYFQGTVDFDPGTGTHNIATAGWYDTFISKLDVSGNFIWAKTFGGSASNIYGYSIAKDSFDNIYSIGYYNGTIDFDPGAGLSNLSSPINDAIYISKLDSSGNFVWVKNIAGTSNDYGHAITIDASNNIYTTGSFGGTADFDPDATGVYNLTSVGIADIFITKFEMPVGIKERAIVNTISVYPNPNNGSFKIKINSEIKNGEFILINSIGQTVYEQKITQGTNQINTNELPEGLYNYILVQDDQQAGYGKIIVE